METTFPLDVRLLSKLNLRWAKRGAWLVGLLVLLLLFRGVAKSGEKMMRTRGGAERRSRR
jgi:hypothetical protein